MSGEESGAHRTSAAGSLGSPSTRGVPEASSLESLWPMQGGRRGGWIGECRTPTGPGTKCLHCAGHMTEATEINLRSQENQRRITNQDTMPQAWPQVLNLTLDVTSLSLSVPTRGVKGRRYMGDGTCPHSHPVPRRRAPAGLTIHRSALSC